ncbi:MAG: hypothetical protein NZ700_16535, partial [Gemmataceae bacterium]|nr:hypothetical protein [Gemmataceae bacterium]MDW8264946.1 hypothetical protein [Gemmataceae bacterium]
MRARARPWPWGLIAVVGSCLVGGGLGGCTPAAWRLRSESGKAKGVVSKKVQLGGAGLVHGQTEAARRSVGELLGRIHQLQAAGDTIAARRWIEKHPDVALEALRSASSGQAASLVLREVAAVYDRQCGTETPTGSWQALLHERSAQPARFASYDQARGQLTGHLEAKRYGEASAVGIVAALPKKPTPRLLEIDAWQLRGLVLLHDDQPAAALEAFTRAAELAQGLPHQYACLLLMMAEASRRSGQEERAAQAWDEAVTLAADQLARRPAIADPEFWERAAHLRPVYRHWPEVVQRQARAFAGRLVACGSAAEAAEPADGAAAHPGVTGESLVWACIGRCRLYRHEGQLALTAFKRAEAMTPDATLRQRLQLAQAEALVQMNQPIAAAAVLANLSLHSDSPVAAPALAMLGALKLQ